MVSQSNASAEDGAFSRLCTRPHQSIHRMSHRSCHLHLVLLPGIVLQTGGVDPSYHLEGSHFCNTLLWFLTIFQQPAARSGWSFFGHQGTHLGALYSHDKIKTMQRFKNYICWMIPVHSTSDLGSLVPSWFPAPWALAEWLHCAKKSSTGSHAGALTLLCTVCFVSTNYILGDFK